MCNNVKIDGNPKMEESLKAYQEENVAEGRRLMKEFLKDVEESGQDHCNCKEPCIIHGKCKECVLQHRGAKDHLPYCFREMVNDRIEKLSAITEHSLKERL
ncbi:LPS biosynthesis protein [Sinanaerobacter sp. ZZT-01]|uniref:LPS biosynthesis protein n=1 Tax=Sinanaerobacter sp. ZZT-01 TaxID=3111540 RepID=UPI002D78CAF3|nr:LPS biosynthesis protein [Sinanaerobacter sp. ZZT-01]WRR94374.1 LPS biosynthesis protein [Sinanaerobacter sp. ZZT-01]